MDQYVRIEQLGAGSFGVVFKARNKVDGKIVAIKRYKLDALSCGIPATIVREASILQTLRHENIVSLIKVITAVSSRTKKPYIALVMDFYPITLDQYLARPHSRQNWDVAHMTPPNMTHLQQHVGLNYDTCVSLFKQLCAGMAFAHSCHVAHRDLKPANILLTHDMKLKIADFGIARQLYYPFHIYSTHIMTLWYRAPEIMFGQGDYDTSVDLWSMGCVLGEMITGSPLFMGRETVEVLEKYAIALGSPQITFPQVVNLPRFRHYHFNQPLNDAYFNTFGSLSHIMRKLLTWDPNARWSAKSCYNAISKMNKQL